MSEIRVLEVLFRGFEEIEAFVPLDLWKRSGIEVVTASITNELEVCGAHGINCCADALLQDVQLDSFDGIFIPGGPGVFELKDNLIILNIIRHFHDKKRLIATICAAPLLLKAAGCLPSMFTAHACVADRLPGCDTQASVVVSGHVVTSRGPGTVFPFAFEVIRRLTSEQVALQLKASIHYEK